jgi:hypothetical protein
VAIEHHDQGWVPRTAYEAADLLAYEGHHVHVVAYGESMCRSRHCPAGFVVVRRVGAGLLQSY